MIGSIRTIMQIKITCQHWIDYESGDITKRVICRINESFKAIGKLKKEFDLW